MVMRVDQEIQWLVKRVEDVLPDIAQIEDSYFNDVDDLELNINVCGDLVIVPIVRYYIEIPEIRSAAVIFHPNEDKIGDKVKMKMNAVSSYLKWRGFEVDEDQTLGAIRVYFSVRNIEENLNIIKTIVESVYFIHLL